MKTSKQQPKRLYVYREPDCLDYLASFDKKQLIKKAVEWSDLAPACADVYSDLPNVEALEWNDELKCFKQMPEGDAQDFTAAEYFEKKYGKQQAKANKFLKKAEAFKSKLERMIEDFEREVEKAFE